MYLDKITRRFLNSIGLLLFLLLSNNSNASHIVGGYMTYTCLGNNQYEIRLRIFRDSVNGGPQYDDPAEIDIYDGNNILLQTLNVPKSPTSLIPLDTGNACISIPPNILIQFADYIDTVTLPPSPTGYTMAYAKCCRNQIISNITNPLQKSSVFFTSIPPNDTSCNSSPKILNNPPIALCVNRPLNLPIETSEQDGDSLYYEICDIMEPNGPTSTPPPFIVIPYLSLIPSSPPFTINSQTGMITGKPNQVGHYVIGICVTEYRNGVPMSKVQLDYQFNVTNCLSIFSDMLTQQEDSSLYCSGLTVNFTDQSQNTNNVIWDFGDTTTLADTSSNPNPTYTYPNPGTYTVRLIAGPNDPCADTTYEQFVVQEGFSFSYSGEEEYCFSEQPVSLVPTGDYPDSVSFEWDFGPGASPRYSSQEYPPPVSWSNGGEHYVKFKVIQGKCEQVYRDTVLIKPELVSDMILPGEDSAMTCNGLTIPFISESLNANWVFWDFGDPSTAADTSRSDTVNYTYDEAGIYPVKLIVSQDGECFDTTSYNLEVHEALTPDMSIGGESCFEAQRMDFAATGSYPTRTQFTWNFGNQAQLPSKTGSHVFNMSWREPGKYPIKLTVEKGFCVEEIFDTVEIRALTVSVDAGDTQVVRSGEPIQLTATQATDYYWSSDHPVIISSPFSKSTTVELSNTNDTLIKFYVRVTDYRGCEGLDSTYVIIDRTEEQDLYNYITPNGDGFNDYLDLSGIIKGDDCSFTVLNRWGSEVYRAREYNNDWRGNDNEGRPLPDGTYYYVVFCSPRVRATGPITIIRSNMQ